MIIKLDDTFHIDVDELNFTLYEKKFTTNAEGETKENLTLHGYFGKLGLALEKYMKIKTLRTFETETITVNKYQESCKNILVEVIGVIPKEIYNATIPPITKNP